MIEMYFENKEFFIQSINNKSVLKKHNIIQTFTFQQNKVGYMKSIIQINVVKTISSCKICNTVQLTYS